MTPQRRLATVLFTDIVDSTKRAAEIGDDRWRQLLQRHHAVVRRELGRFGGRELNMTGDGFLAAFDVPERALRCAWAIRDELRAVGLEIRAGLHTGEVEVMEKTVGGLGVHIGARVAAHAAPGEVLVSSTVRDVVAGSGFAFEDRGVHELKGVPGEWRLSALVSAPVRLPVSTFWVRTREARLPRVLTLYVAASALILWVASLLSEELGLPGWVFPSAILLLVIGLLVLTATALVQSRAVTASRAQADEVPSSWELDLGDIRSSLARGRLPHLTWARAILGGLVAFSLLFGLSGLYVHLRDRGPSFSPQELTAGPEPALAVLPFRVVGPGLELWREGMVDLLSANLDGAPGIRTIPPRTVLSRWRSAIADAGQEPTDVQAVKVAGAAGARHALVGSIVALGGEVRLTADVYHVPSGKVVGEVQVKGPPDSLPALVDRLSLEVLRQGIGSPPGTSATVNVRRLTTPSFQALKAYLAGEQSFRQARWNDAIGHFERALETDSTFALALYRLSLAHGWIQGNSPLAFRYARRAARYAEGMPERERLLLLGWAGCAACFPTEDTDWRDGLRRLEELTARYPDDAEAWYILGDSYFHLGGLTLYPLDKFREAFHRALLLDPSFAPAYIHPISDAFARYDSAAALRLITRHNQIDPTSPAAVGYEIAYGLTWGDSSSRERSRSRLETVDSEALARAAFALAWAREFWQESVLLSQRATDPRHPLTERVSGQRQTGRMYFLLGQSAKGRDAYLGVPGEEGFRPAAPTLLSFHMAELLDRETVRRAAAALTADTSTLARFLRGTVAADEGDDEEAGALARSLETQGAPVGVQDSTVLGPKPAVAAAALRGYVAAARGNRREAIRLLEQALPEIGGVCPGDWCLPHSALRYRLGKLLLEDGRADEAEPYLRSLETFSPFAHTELYLGKLYEQLGDLEEAKLHYARLVRWWENCDPELRPIREEARQALNRLTGVKRM